MARTIKQLLSIWSFVGSTRPSWSHQRPTQVLPVAGLSASSGCQGRLHIIQHRLPLACQSIFKLVRLKNSRRKSRQCERLELGCLPGLAGVCVCWGGGPSQHSFFTHRALVKGAKVSTYKTCSCSFRTFDLTADSEPSRPGQGRVEREATEPRGHSQKVGVGALFPKAAAAA